MDKSIGNWQYLNIMQRDWSLFSRLSKEIAFNQGNEVRSAKLNPGSSVVNIESEMGGKIRECEKAVSEWE